MSAPLAAADLQNALRRRPLPNTSGKQPKIDKARSIEVCSRHFEGPETCAEPRSYLHNRP